MGLLTGSITGSTVAATLSSAAATIMGGTWGSAGTIIASVVGMITSPLIPFYIAGVAIVSLLVMLAAKTAFTMTYMKGFADAMTYLKARFWEFAGVIMTVANALKEALAAGQYTNAAKILWAGVKQIFWMGILEIVKLVFSLPSMVGGALMTFGKAFLGAVKDIFMFIPKMIWNALTGRGGGMSIGDMIGAALNGGDWLEGLATDKIADARNELGQLTEAAKLARTEASQAREKKEADEQAAMLAKAGVDRGGADMGTGDGSASVDTDDAAQAMQRLQREIDELTMGADAAADAELAAKGRADGKSEDDIQSELAAIAALRDRKKALEDSKQAELDASAVLVDRIEKQASKLSEAGMSADEIYQRQLTTLTKNNADGNISDEDYESSVKQAGTDRDDRKQRIQDEGKQLADSLKTPVEKYNDRIKDIVRLQQAGAIDQQTAYRAIAKERESLNKETSPASPAAGATDEKLATAELGSKAAMDAIARSRQIASGGPDRGTNVPPQIAPLVGAAQRQLVATMETPQRLAAAMAAQRQQAVETKQLEDIANQQLVAQNRIVGVMERVATNTATSGGDVVI